MHISNLRQWLNYFCLLLAVIAYGFALFLFIQSNLDNSLTAPAWSNPADLEAWKPLRNIEYLLLLVSLSLMIILWLVDRTPKKQLIFESLGYWFIGLMGVTFGYALGGLSVDLVFVFYYLSQSL